MMITSLRTIYVVDVSGIPAIDTRSAPVDC